MENKKDFEIIRSSFTEKSLYKIFNYYRDIEWTSDNFIIAGKKVTPLRKTFMFGKDYSYSGVTKKSKKFDHRISFIANKIEEQLNLEKGYFNACLLNLYESGEANISYHKDNEKDLEEDAIIVAFSLGQKRKFYFKNDKTMEVIKLFSDNGDYLIMYPGAQKNWKHSIPKELKIKEARISLTFRRFK